MEISGVARPASPEHGWGDTSLDRLVDGFPAEWTHDDTPETVADAVAEAAGGGDVSLLVRDDATGWTVLVGPSELVDGRRVSAVLNGEASGSERASRIVWVTAGNVAAVVSDPARPEPELLVALKIACRWLRLILDRVKDVASDRDLLAALQHVARAILCVRDLDQVLSSITSHLLELLEADISGVFLLEGDELVMRHCVGHWAVEMEEVRMRSGQGLAGRVLSTGEPCKVASYVQDETISEDFKGLGRREHLRSALGVPLQGHETMIGVVEVWRREESVFSDQDVRTLVALANLAAIAIENARLYEQQAESVHQLDRARADLEEQLGSLRCSARFQRSLFEALLASDDFPQIAHTTAREIGCDIVIISPDGGVLAASPSDLDVERITEAVGSWRSERPTMGRATNREDTRRVVSLAQDRRVWSQQVWAGEDAVCTVCLVSAQQSSELMEIARGQAALACALQHLKQRVASRARSEAREEVLWDLLQGPMEHRVAAMNRAERMQIQLRGPHRVAHGILENVEDIARMEGWDTSAVQQARRQIKSVARRVIERDSGQLMSMRGDLIVAMVAVETGREARAVVSELQAEIADALPAIRSVWGVSAMYADPLNYASAFEEAKTAVSAARRLGVERVQIFDELGVLRLLLGSGQGGDFSQFVTDVIGPVIDYDRTKNGMLLETLRAYFDADCSQKLTAQRMVVHYKTLRYRLKRIEKLTGLDLSRHDDRMRADLALRIHLVEPTEEGG